MDSIDLSYKKWPVLSHLLLDIFLFTFCPLRPFLITPYNLLFMLMWDLAQHTTYLSDVMYTLSLALKNSFTSIRFNKISCNACLLFWLVLRTRKTLTSTCNFAITALQTCLIWIYYFQRTYSQHILKQFNLKVVYILEELDGLAISALRRAIAEVKQRWSVIGWVAKNLLSRVRSCFGRHVKPLVLAIFAVVSTSWWVMARSPYV
jgi:hypothetical protein